MAKPMSVQTNSRPRRNKATVRPIPGDPVNARPCDVKSTPTGRTVIEAAAGPMQAFVETGLNLAHADDFSEGQLLAHDNGVIGERYILGGENLSLQQIL
jgi:dihydroflavonol-4-reductase